MSTREQCQALDERDELAPLRGRFTLADDVIYLDGNSLGPVSDAVRRRVSETIEHEWAQGLVGSWSAAGWMAAPTRLGDRVAPLIGARPGEVVVADTLTFALAKQIGRASCRERVYGRV